VNVKVIIATVLIAGMNATAPSCGGGGAGSHSTPRYKVHGFVVEKPPPRGITKEDYVLIIREHNDINRSVSVDEYVYNHCGTGDAFPDCAAS
jgi:hypothetical protein